MTMKSKTCARCGASFEPAANAQKYCGPGCASAKRRSDNAVCGRRRYAAEFGQRHPVSFPNCDECGRIYCRHSGGIRAVNVCPDGDCQRAAHNRRTRNALHTRRARLRGAHVERVDPRKVFARDEYRCHLCEHDTDRTKAGHHPQAPTVDHVIPLSRGGAHSYANCRTACYACNRAKGNRMPAQLCA